MKDKHKRTILRLELEVEEKNKEILAVRAQLLVLGLDTAAAEAARADLKILLDEAVGAVKQSIIETEEARDERDAAKEATAQAEADAEDVRNERDGVQEENDELRQTLSREQEDWRQERSGLEYRVSEAESQRHAVRLPRSLG